MTIFTKTTTYGFANLDCVVWSPYSNKVVCKFYDGTEKEFNDILQVVELVEKSREENRTGPAKVKHVFDVLTGYQGRTEEKEIMLNDITTIDLQEGLVYLGSTLLRITRKDAAKLVQLCISKGFHVDRDTGKVARLENI